MWADHKTVFFEILFNVSKVILCYKVQFLQCSYGVMAAIFTFQHSIAFEPMNKIKKKKTKLFWNLPTCGKQVLIF